MHFAAVKYASPSYTDYLKLDRELQKQSSALDPLRIAVLRSCTLEPILAPLRVELASIHYKAEINFHGFNQIESELLNPSSDYCKNSPDITWLHPTPDMFCPKLVWNPYEMSEAQIEDEIQICLNRISSLIDQIAASSKRLTLISGFMSPARPHPFHPIHKLNLKIKEITLNKPSVYFLDLDELSRRVGLENVIDLGLHYQADLPLSHRGLVEVSKEIKRSVFKASGKSAKCIVVDLDDTLWGGVVGESGAKGVTVGPDGSGRPYYDFQRALKSLQSRGFLLAISSKNNESDANEVFILNEGMVLELEDFVSRKINWNPKSQSLREMATELDLGLSSFVFIDNSPAERDLIRQQLPEVFTPDFPDDISQLADWLENLYVFEKALFSDEDRFRTELYRNRAKAETLRTSVLAQTGSMNDYYKSLEMELEISKNDLTHAPRLSQLTQKTNQFNLTHLRLSEAEVRDRIESPNFDVYSARLKDRFGDNGIVAMVSVARNPMLGEAEIELFLMSCRVIGRTVENALLSVTLEQLKNAGINRVKARFIPNPRNDLTRRTYAVFGFNEISEHFYLWDLESKAPPQPPTWFFLNKTNFN